MCAGLMDLDGINRSRSCETDDPGCELNKDRHTSIRTSSLNDIV